MVNSFLPREPAFPGNNQTLKLTILGRCISKKNSKVVGRNRYSGKQFFTSNQAWKNFEADSLFQLKGIKARFYQSINIDYIFYFKGKMGLDADNAMSGINDILELSGIIDSDKNIISGHFKLVRDQPDWKSVILLTQLK